MLQASDTNLVEIFLLMTKKIDPHSSLDLISLLHAGLHCNHAELSKQEQNWICLGEPTEAALVAAAYKAGLSRPKKVNRLSEFSFTSERKRMSVVEEKGR